MKIYTIGDIHGQFDVFSSLILKIRLDAGNEDFQVITLGDYVDRGPKSKQVLDFLMNPNIPLISLKGNHEEMMVDALRKGKDHEKFWRKLGGKECLESFGISKIAEIDRKYIDFIDTLPLNYEDEFRFYVHAGLLPGVLISDHQKVMSQHYIKHSQVYLWIRDEFLESKFEWEKLVVHGHTPRKEIEIKKNRINCDVGSKRLVAARFDSGSRELEKFIYSH